jgi:hypothetical protein
MSKLCKSIVKSYEKNPEQRPDMVKACAASRKRLEREAMKLHAERDRQCEEQFLDGLADMELRSPQLGAETRLVYERHGSRTALFYALTRIYGTNGHDDVTDLMTPAEKRKRAVTVKKLRALRATAAA